MSLTNVWVQTQGDGLVRADQIVGIKAHQTPALAGKPARWLFDVVLTSSIGSGTREGWGVTVLHRTLIQTGEDPGDAPAALARLLSQLDLMSAAGTITPPRGNRPAHPTPTGSTNRSSEPGGYAYASCPSPAPPPDITPAPNTSERTDRADPDRLTDFGQCGVDRRQYQVDCRQYQSVPIELRSGGSTENASPWVPRTRSRYATCRHSCMRPPSRFRFPPEVIMLAVRWYLRYGLSYRDVEELLAERGIVVDHVTIYRWVQRFTPELIDAARPSRHVAGDRWFVDETYLKVADAGGTCTGRSTSTGRSSTFSPHRSGILRRPAGSLPGR